MTETQPAQSIDLFHFACDCEEWQREACAGEGFYAQFGNNRYCILHYPADKDQERFNAAVERKLYAEVRDYNFQGVWFPAEFNQHGHQFISAANFSGATFNSRASFYGAKFDQSARFENATFYAEAIFSNGTFGNEATFESARFHGEADFTSVTFNADAIFLSAIFSAEANFKAATFNARTSFVYALFERRAEFMAATFNGETYFRQMVFGSEAIFDSATFGGWAHFDSTKFNSFAVFERAKFNSLVVFESTIFSGEALFNSVEFKENSVFRAAAFNANAQFVSCSFKFAIFDAAFFKEKADFQWSVFTCVGFGSARFKAIGSFQSAKFGPDTIFDGACFHDYADFMLTTFDPKVTFNCTEFIGKARFTKMNAKGIAVFENAIFHSEADFQESCFDAEANFCMAKFNGSANFKSSFFAGKLYFSPATFKADADFSSATFKDNAMFVCPDGDSLFADQSTLNLTYAIIEKPERVSFHHCWLRPKWFLLVDSRKFEFNNVEWRGLEDELKRLKSGSDASHKELHIAYRQLATNAEENHRYAEASQFRFASLEARRLEKFRGFVPWRLEWGYWLASCYGESVRRAFVVFVSVIALFTVSYAFVNFDHPGKAPTNSAASSQPASDPSATPSAIRPLNWKDAIIYSLNVSILQKPEPKPYSFAAKLLVWLETVLGPAQAALLALAVRRRFMR